MPSQKAELILHPVRTRILATLLGRHLTTQQIARLLPDVPQPSLYRHVRLLAEAGIIAPVEEVRVNGALVKVYGVPPGQAQVAAAETSDAGRAERLSHFTTFLNILAEKFRASLEQDSFEPDAGLHHSLMGALHLSPEEYEEFQKALDAFLRPWAAKEPGGDRRRLIFAHLALPDSPDPPRM